MRFGAAKEITTPPFKMKLACSGKMDVDYEDIYDDTYARCPVFDNGENKFLLIRNQQKYQRWICRGTEE